MSHGISLWPAYAFAWITLGLFGFSLAGHWLFGWFAYVDEQTTHGQPIEVGGLALFLHLGSPQSREGDERKEAKLDALLRQLGPAGERIIGELDQKYPRR